MRLPYYSNCVDWDKSDIKSLEDLCENAREITYRTFLRNVNTYQVRSLELDFGYDRHLRMKDDYHVKYFVGTLHNKRAYFFCWSAIEYVFAER